VWHSTDSVLYLERLCDEQSEQIIWLRGELEKLSFPTRINLAGTEISASPTKMPEPINKEKWSTIQQKIKSEMRKDALKQPTEGPN
jgi:hypothetical protein